MSIIWNWLNKRFGDPQIIGLGLFLLVIAGVIWVFGNMLMPVLASLVIAYLLNGFVVKIEKRGVPRIIAVIIVFLIFMAVTVLFLIGVIPLLSDQLSELAKELPNKLQEMIASGQQLIDQITEKYPQLINFGGDQADQTIKDASEVIAQVARDQNSTAQATNLIVSANEAKNSVRDTLFTAEQLGEALKGVFSIFSVKSVVAVITVLVYMVIMPILIFFFLKDKDILINWCLRFLPKDRKMIGKIWAEVDIQIGNYVRGKFIEVIIVGATTYVTFVFLGVKFSLLLAVLVGLSVIIPYVGAAVVTLPVLILGYAQFGWSTEFTYLVIAYSVIQALDGNALVPLLFSGVVNIHPIAIIVSILVFGGMWGVWGVFFAIPLATFIQAVINAWPKATFSARREKIREARAKE